MSVKQLMLHVAKALKTLREVESRAWDSILLSSVDPINEGGEALKLLKIAHVYEQFFREYPQVNADARHESYQVLRAAYNNAHFPRRKHLSKAQFEYLLVLHLDNF